jgi:hypothetical protein
MSSVTILAELEGLHEKLQFLTARVEGAQDAFKDAREQFEALEVEHEATLIEMRALNAENQMLQASALSRARICAS